MSEQSPEVNFRFINFLNHTATRARMLFLLGDIFDIWLGDDDDALWLGEVKTALKALTDGGVPVFVQRGNRDFLLGRRFMSATGCLLLPDEYALSAADGNYLLVHGDQLTAEVSYRRYRRWGRPLLALAAVFLSLARRRSLAARLRRASSEYRREAAVDGATLTALMRRHHCATAIHGHLHRQEEVCWQVGDNAYRRFGLPDWHTAPGYAALTPDGLRFYDA